MRPLFYYAPVRACRRHQARLIAKLEQVIENGLKSLKIDYTAL